MKRGGREGRVHDEALDFGALGDEGEVVFDAVRGFCV